MRKQSSRDQPTTAVPTTGIWPSPESHRLLLWSVWLADLGYIEGIVLKRWTHSRWSRRRTTWTLCEVIPLFFLNCSNVQKTLKSSLICIKWRRSMFLNFRDDIPVKIMKNWSYGEIMYYSNGFVLCECHLILKNIDKELQVDQSVFFISLAVYKVLFQTFCL